MKIFRSVILFIAIIFVAGLFFWALFAPKEDISQKIYKTLQEQSKRADLSFKKVTFEEISNGVKYWQLEAENAVVNKDAGIAALQDTRGTFFADNRPALKFRSPAALWEMKKKEILLDHPLGYDAAYEKQILPLIDARKNQLRSVFTFPGEFKQKLGYWFQAKNLSWELASQQLLCSGGILLNKGDATGYAESLKGDVEFNRVEISGSPRIVIASPQNSPLTFEALTFELLRAQDLFVARGNPRLIWKEANIASDSASYLQAENKVQLAGKVNIHYKDIAATGDSADYFAKEQNVILYGNARARQGDNILTSDKVMVSFRDQKISLLGKSKVIITDELISSEVK